MNLNNFKLLIVLVKKKKIANEGLIFLFIFPFFLII